MFVSDVLDVAVAAPTAVAKANAGPMPIALASQSYALVYTDAVVVVRLWRQPEELLRDFPFRPGETVVSQCECLSEDLTALEAARMAAETERGARAEERPTAALTRCFLTATPPSP